MPTTITAENFRDTVQQAGIVMLDWWAPWCGPCRAFAPVFEKAAEANPDVVFGKVNTDEQQELAAAFRISAIPTLMIFRDGVLLFAQPGMVPPEGLTDLLQQVRGLDMDKVRAEIAAQAEAEEPEGHEGHEGHAHSPRGDGGPGHEQG